MNLGGLIFMALSWGLIIFLMIYAFGKHFLGKNQP
jgi:glycerol uptake facilitator-like aquaporin